MQGVQPVELPSSRWIYRLCCSRFSRLLFLISFFIFPVFDLNLVLPEDKSQQLHRTKLRCLFSSRKDRETFALK